MDERPDSDRDFKAASDRFQQAMATVAGLPTEAEVEAAIGTAIEDYNRAVDAYNAQVDRYNRSNGLTEDDDSAETLRHLVRNGGCPVHIGMSRLVCGSCWDTVPKPLRDKIMRTWDPRGGIRQSDEYHAAAAAARKYLAPPNPELPL